MALCSTVWARGMLSWNCIKTTKHAAFDVKQKTHFHIVFPFCVCIRTVEKQCFTEVQHTATALSHIENTMPLISRIISKTVTYLVRAHGWDNRECFIWGLALVLEEKQITLCLVRIKLLHSSTVPINCMFRNKAEQSDLLRTLILKKWKSQLSE